MPRTRRKIFFLPLQLADGFPHGKDGFSDVLNLCRTLLRQIVDKRWPPGGILPFDPLVIQSGDKVRGPNAHTTGLFLILSFVSQESVS